MSGKTYELLVVGDFATVAHTPFTYRTDHDIIVAGRNTLTNAIMGRRFHRVTVLASALASFDLGARAAVKARLTPGALWLE